MGGMVDHISRDILGSAYVTVKAQDSDRRFRAVQCFLANPSDGVNLLPRAPVNVTGRVQGLMMNVMLKDCLVAKAG